MKTQNHKWYNYIKQGWCVVWGHNMFAGSEHNNEGYVFYDYCRQCETILGVPSFNYGKRVVSLNVKHKLLLLRIKVGVWLNKFTNK